MDVPFFLSLFVLSHLLLLHSFSAQEDNKIQITCPKSFDCKPFRQPLRFPFSNSTYPQCGLCTVTCDEPLSQIQLGNEGPWYDVVATEENLSGYIFQIRDQFLQTQLGNQSCDIFENLSFPITSSVSFTIYNPYLTFFKCHKNFDLKDYHFKDFHNYTNCTDYNLYYKFQDDLLSSPARHPPSCSVIQLPRKLSDTKNHTEDDPFNLVTDTFPLELHVSEDCQRCYLGGGQCQNYNQKFHCATTNKGGTKHGWILATGKKAIRTNASKFLHKTSCNLRYITRSGFPCSMFSPAAYQTWILQKRSLYLTHRYWYASDT